MFAAQFKPAARRSDDATSHLAAADHTASGARERNCARVLRGVRQHPGCTSFELSVRIGMQRHEVARRLPELLACGLVEKGEPRPCEISGKRAVTWRAVPEQMELAA